MQKTKIEYLDYTWNPLAMRCTPVSEGCANCWHIKMADRLAKNPSISVLDRAAYTEGLPEGPRLREQELEGPLHVRKPSIIGVQFMGDLFHEAVTDNDRDNVFDVMLRTMSPLDRSHLFLVLTKRIKEAARYFDMLYQRRPNEDFRRWPLPVWLGVSCENQARADERIPVLLQIPAAKRWVSIEPMLGPIVLRRKAGDEREMVQMALMGRLEEYSRPVERGIDWVVLGGETGPGARPMHPDWARSVRDQCQAAGVPFFFKQWGEWVPWGGLNGECLYGMNLDQVDKKYRHTSLNGASFYRVGQKLAGHLLDGREWREMP